MSRATKYFKKEENNFLTLDPPLPLNLDPDKEKEQDMYLTHIDGVNMRNIILF